ncbi:MAG TPA: glycosyltransferase family 4 protein [Steroidobacteraceae bacterium]|nr:glycosyltransferase family 4 protein [Steroidobacteraceae bacterium]
MRILFCNYEYPPLGGGGGVVMAALARELARRRHTVTVLTSRALDLPAESIEQGVRVLRVPVFFRRQLAVANFPSMLAYLPMALARGGRLRGEFDVINTHFVVPTGPVGERLARAHRIPNVLSVHGGDLYDPSKPSSPHRHPWLRAPIRRMLRRASALVGQSRNTLEHVERIYGVKRASELIPLGIDPPPAVPAAARAELGIPEAALVLVSVGRVVARKAAPQLIEAMARAERPVMHLVLIGEGPELAAVRAAAEARGLAARVHLLGQVSEERKYALLALADVFASTSQHEGFGLVFLEAMALGLPVVCYDHGGQTDFLRSGKTGFVLPLNDVSAFARGLQALHDDPALRAAMGEHNRRAVEDYLIGRCAERYEQVFESVIRAFAARAEAPACVE